MTSLVCGIFKQQQEQQPTKLTDTENRWEVARGQGQQTMNQSRDVENCLTTIVNSAAPHMIGADVRS